MNETFSKLAQKLLCPPGNGVFTVNTASDKKKMLHSAMYPLSNSGSIREKWIEETQEIKDNQLSLLSIPSDCGGGIHRGANWGPLFIRLEILKGLAPRREQPRQFNDLGDVRVIPHLLHDKYLNSQTLESCRQALYEDKDCKLSVSPLSIAEDICNAYYQEFPLGRLYSLGGDHSVSYPVVKSYLRHKKKQGTKVALIHFDAHTDLLRKRLGIDLCFGSWTTHILEDLPSPDHCIQIGIRSSGRDRGHWENQFGVKQHWSQEVFDRGAPAIASEIRENLKAKGVQEIYISFDIDALDATIAGATGTPEIGGLRMDQCFLIMRELCDHFKLGGADLMEVAPFLNMPIPGKLNPEPDSTLMAARSLSEFFIEQMGTAD
jgi:agmatinase